MNVRKPYPSDVGNEVWEFVAPYLSLLPLDAGERDHDLREVFHSLRWLVCSGASWRLLQHHLPHWYMVYRQTQRWFKAGCFESIALDLHMATAREPTPSAAVMG